MKISVTKARKQLPELIRRAEAGEEIIVRRHGQPQVLRTITGVSPVQPPETFRNYHPQFLQWGRPFCILGYPCVPHTPRSLPLDRTRRLVMS